MKPIGLVFAAAILLSGCGDSTVPAQSPQSPGAKPKLDKWSWLPSNDKYTAEASSLPTNTLPAVGFWVTEPIHLSGTGKLEPSGEITPTRKDSYKATGGVLLSAHRPIERRAGFDGWDFIYEDAARTKPVGWGFCVVTGEVLLHRSAFLDIPTNRYAQNSFEIEPFGDQFVLIRLDPKKGHKLCLMKEQPKPEQQAPSGLASLGIYGADSAAATMTSGKFSGYYKAIPTAGYLGSKADVDGKVLERKADGWYFGTTRFSE